MELSGSFFNYKIFDNCEFKNSKELICPITRTEIEEFLGYSGELFEIHAYNDYIGTVFLDSVAKIKINYENVTKEIIFINNAILLNTVGELNKRIAYETNIEDITPISSQRFFVDFIGFGKSVCYFKKSEGSN